VKFLFPDGSYDVSAHVAAGFVRFAAAYLRSGFVCAVLMCLASPVHAQEEVGSVYVAAGISFPNQLPKESGSPPPFSAPAGATVGWSIGAGIFVHPRISLEGELSTTGVMRRDEGGRHDLRAVAQRKDRFVSLAVKGHLEVRSAVRVEPLGGLVFVREQASGESFTYRVSPDFSSREVSSSSEWNVEPEWEWRPGVMFGVDLRIGGRHVAFVPGLRATFATVQPESRICTVSRPPYSPDPRCQRGSPFQYDYYPRWTYRPALSLGLSF